MKLKLLFIKIFLFQNVQIRLTIQNGLHVRDQTGAAGSGVLMTGPCATDSTIALGRRMNLRSTVSSTKR